MILDVKYKEKVSINQNTTKIRWT